MLYKYVLKHPYYYGDLQIANTNDILDITEDTVHNKTTDFTFTNLGLSKNIVDCCDSCTLDVNQFDSLINNISANFQNGIENIKELLIDFNNRLKTLENDIHNTPRGREKGTIQ